MNGVCFVLLYVSVKRCIALVAGFGYGFFATADVRDQVLIPMGNKK